ncbi:MAG: HAMP domain-containing protein [Deltaproteobacteria bacterium]|nr:HAMP domain-containing protein [Deltaproteobacteria bacterium]
MLPERMPVRFRLSFTHAIWMAIIYMGIGYGLYKVVENHLNDSVNAALISSAQSIRDSRYSWENISLRDFMMEQFFQDPLPISPFGERQFIKPYARIISISGKIQSQTDNVVASLPMTLSAIRRAEQGLLTLETFSFSGKAPLRQITLPVLHKNQFTGDIVQVGVFLNHTTDTLRGTALVLWLVLPTTLFISVLLGYILTARALKPVRVITRAASQMGIDDLNIRLPVPAAKDELQELSRTFNRLLDHLEDAVRRLRRFTGDVSHELRTPLTVLRGEAELALKRERTPEEYRNSLRTIARESAGMSTTIENLLLLARAESNSVAMRWESVDSREFIRQLAEDVQPVFQKHQVALEVDSGNSTAPLCCSQGYLSLALKNILFNAAKHSFPGGVVLFGFNSGPDCLSFEVTDRGEGIPEDCLPDIFDPFYRADTARNRAAGGVGIGLSLAQALIRLHRGTISVRSKPGSGSTFTISIPNSAQTSVES